MTRGLCPVCGTSEIPKLVMKVNATQAATHFVNTSGATNQDALKSKISELWGGNDCRILCCERCLSRFAEPHVAGDSRFYELAFPISAYPKSRWEFDLAKKLLPNRLERMANYWRSEQVPEFLSHS